MNMDMVGTGDKDLYVGGMWEFSDFYDLLKENMQEKFKEKLKYRIDYRGSDHSAFLSKGVTCISLRSGNVLTRELDDEHPEYHRPGDTPATIKPELLQQASEYHYDNIVFLANCKENLLDPKHHLNFIHKDSNVIDMHCDTIGRFLRGQDLSKDNPKGHIDIPKLKQGAVVDMLPGFFSVWFDLGKNCYPQRIKKIAKRTKIFFISYSLSNLEFSNLASKFRVGPS